MSHCEQTTTAAPEVHDGVRRYALIGNPNAGKTTLFNELTGSSQHVGNWPGVTVEKKVGTLRDKYREGGGAQIIDLPGIYSLSPHSIEERISRSFIIDEKPDVVIDIVEATNLERNLFLTCQIAELGVPMVVAVNMMDEAAKSGEKIDIAELSSSLGLPVFPITAVKGEGVIELMDTVGAQELVEAVDLEASHPYHEGEDEHGHGFQDIEDPEEHRLDHHTDELGRTNALIAEYKYHNHYKGPKVFQPAPGEELDDEREHENAEARYRFISEVVSRSVTRGEAVDPYATTDRIDRVLTHRFFGIPIFLLIMFIMFHFTFSNDFLYLSHFGLPEIPSPGVWLQDVMAAFVEWVSGGAQAVLVPGTWVYGLIVDGIIGGVGAVLSFLPQICVLFFFLTLLEDIGYMSRAAFIMDRLLRPVGLSGKSFVPMIMGFGCGVPAMMACRTMENENDRKLTLFLIPFMSCGARAPIYLAICAAFFPENAEIAVFAIYLLGIVVAILTALLLSKTILKSGASQLIIELPRYRPPHGRSLGLALWKTIKDYLRRAGTIIFCMSVVIWFLSSFGFDGGFGMVDMENSILALLGKFIAPIFTPLGFGFWTAAVALLTGFIAKEAVVSTMGVLYNAAGSGEAGLSAAMLAAAGFTPLSAFSFMVFVLLYLPCMAALATLRRESNSRAWTYGQVAYGLVVAWVCAFIVYQVGSLIGFA